MKNSKNYEPNPLIGLAVGLALIVIALVLAQIMSRRECRITGELAGRKTDYQFSAAGCYIEDNGRMVPVKNWRIQ